MANLVVYAIDVGSTRQKPRTRTAAFAWARAVSDAGITSIEGGGSLTAMCDAMNKDALAGATATLGIEAPLWLPIPDEQNEKRLSEGRHGERDRSCFAPAGGYVAMLGLHQLAHILSRLPRGWRPSVDWGRWDPADQSQLLIWEAFVSGVAHSGPADDRPHVRDAATAAAAFLRGATKLATDVAPDSRRTLSLAGAALLWSERVTDVGVLSEPTLVIRPSARFEGAIARTREDD